MSIHQDCSSCTDPSENSQHLFLPVYLDSSGTVLDNSQNAVSSLDSSYNFLMDASFIQANYIRLMLTYKKINNLYTFKFNNTYKTLLDNSVKADIENTNISIYDCSFNSGNIPTPQSLGNVFVQYIADTLLGHPMSQAFIANDDIIVNDINSSNLHLQFSTALTNTLNTSTFQSNDICNSILLQLKSELSDRFINEVENTEYPLPLCPGDYISLFVKMKSNIQLDNTVGYTNPDPYNLLKTMFQTNQHVEFDDNNSLMKLKERIWRIRIKLT